MSWASNWGPTLKNLELLPLLSNETERHRIHHQVTDRGPKRRDFSGKVEIRKTLETSRFGEKEYCSLKIVQFVVFFRDGVEEMMRNASLFRKFCGSRRP